jgi:hypothetical protein
MTTIITRPLQAQAPHRPGSKYFFLHSYRAGERVPVVVWNGVARFRNAVPDFLLENEPAFAGALTFAIVHIRRPVGGRRSARGIVAGLQASYDAIILFTRDTATYQSVIGEFRLHAVANMEGAAC